MEIPDSSMVWVWVGVILFGCLCWVVGRWADIAWRVKRMRQFLKTNTIMIKFITKDRKTIDSIAANIDNARVKLQNSIIVIDKLKIYREGKPQEGFVMNKNHIKWEEGVPTLYVYADSLKPADFFTEPSNVSAEDVGTVLISFARIEIMKGLAKLEDFKKYTMFFYAIGFGILIIAIGLIIIYQEVHTANVASVQAQNNTIMIMERLGIGQQINGTLVLRGS